MVTKMVNNNKKCPTSIKSVQPQKKGWTRKTSSHANLIYEERYGARPTCPTCPTFFPLSKNFFNKLKYLKQKVGQVGQMA